MKKIEAIIKPSKLKDVQLALKEADIPCMSVVNVKGTGLQKSYSQTYRGSEKSNILKSRVMIICVISDENLEKCINIILDAASTESVGDGKIFVYEVQNAIRIRTRTRGSEAIK